MRTDNINMLDDTLNILQQGFYIYEGRITPLKLSQAEMRETLVYLPEDVQKIGRKRICAERAPCSFRWKARRLPLPCRYVIHTVGPVWYGGKRNEAKLLADCYLNSLQLAVKHGIRRIAFPSISTGVYCYPKDQAAVIAVNTVNEFVEANPGALELVEWALFDDDTLRAYTDALDMLKVNKTVRGTQLDRINRMLRDGLV